MPLLAPELVPAGSGTSELRAAAPFADRTLSDVPAQDEIDALVDESADELHAEGKIDELHRDLGYLHRTAALYEQCPEIHGKVAGGVGFPAPTERRPTAGKAFFELMTAPSMLAMMQQVMHSTEVFVSGVYRLRPKLPDKDNGVVPW